MSNLHVAVLMGGTSTERAISLSTGRQILAALSPDRYTAIGLDAAGFAARVPGGAPARVPAGPGQPPPSATHAPAAEPGLVQADLIQLKTGAGGRRPDVVFIALHGRGGEDGTIQGLLEVLGIRYTGSGVLASALAMDKAMSKKVFAAEGIPVPRDVVVRAHERRDPAALASRVGSDLGWPVVVKPNTQGSTIGCTIVRRPADLEPAVQEALGYDDIVLIEQFVTGTEITVGLLGNEAPEPLPIIEIVPRGGFYDFEAKYAPGGSDHIIPARISSRAAERARDLAVRCHQVLGCRGMSRVDLIVAGDEPAVLEINTIPGMTPTSLLPDAARAVGITFGDLLDRLIAYALD